VLAGTGGVVELGDLLLDEGLLEIAALADDVVLDSRLLGALGLLREGAFRLADQLAVVVVVDTLARWTSPL
jgi:hypothetical protein